MTGDDTDVPPTGQAGHAMRYAAGALLALWLAAALAWAWFALPAWGEHAHVQLALVGEAGVRHQLYHSSTGVFAEADSVFAPADAGGTARLALRLPHAQARFLRVDAGSDAPVRLCRLDVDAGLHALARLDGFKVVRARQLAALETRRGCLELVPETGATDPYVMLEAPSPVQAWQAPPGRRGSLAILVVTALALAAVLAVLAVRREAPAVVLSRFAQAIHMRLPWVYLVLAVALGLAYVLIAPPGAVPDEIAHTTKALKIAHGEPIGDSGKTLFPDVYRMYGDFNGFLNPATRFTPAQLEARAASPVLCEGTTSKVPAFADGYGPQLYLAPAAAYALACATDAGFGPFVWAARAGNLLIAALLVALGLWCSQRARWPLFVIALMPMTLHQMASLSADAVYFGLCFAWLGLTCGIAEGRISARRAVPALALLALLLTFAKPGGAWVLASALFLRGAFHREYGRAWPALLALVVLPAIAHGAWVLGLGAGVQPPPHADPALNLSRIATDPGHVLQLFATALTGTHGWELLRSMIGKLGWLDITLPTWAYATVLASLSAALLLARGGRPPALAVRALALVLALGSVLMLSLPMYVFWTPPDASRVGGLQGRYFIPSLAFAWAWLAVSAPRRLQEPLMLALPIAMTMPLLQGLLDIAMRYYPL